jgi:hypothetical protein
MLKHFILVLHKTFWKKVCESDYNWSFGNSSINNLFLLNAMEVHKAVVEINALYTRKLKFISVVKFAW